MSKIKPIVKSHSNFRGDLFFIPSEFFKLDKIQKIVEDAKKIKAVQEIIERKKASAKLKGKHTGSQNPFAKKIEVNGIIYGSITECLKALNISSYKLKKYYQIKEIK